MKPAIETERLLLRSWTDADVAAWAEMNADPRVMEFFPSTIAREKSYESAQLMRTDLEENGYGWFVMEIKERPGFSGVLAIDDVRWETPFQPRREIGWRLPVHAWGHGYATEGARALLDFAYNTLHWDEVVAFTAKLNERSQRVMQRLGMTHDPVEDFEHPRVPEGHPIRPHVLYRARWRSP
jgi:ribosomal-protein-alanine N-acetyltransferase